MYDYNNFEDSFDFNVKVKYSPKQVENIEANRKQIEGLFVDRVLNLLEIKRPAKHYPPKNNSDLRSLHQLIVGSNAADHAKLSLIYYLRLDCGNDEQEGSGADKFAEQAMLPKKHQIFMKGLWYMDKREFDLALQYLTHPSLIPTFHEEILETLVRQSPRGDYSRALSYYYTVQPTITSPQAMDSLFTAIARTSITEAFYFARSQADFAHRTLFQSLISRVLQAKPNDTTAARAVELVNLPFSIEEEAWFEEYLTHGAGRQYKLAKDTIMMRRIATGKSKAASLDGLEGKQVNGMNWETLQAGIEKGLGPRLDIL